MSGRILTERLLATTSLAALIFAAGTPTASAIAPCATIVAAGASYSNSGAVSCVVAPNASVSITNNASGTIGPTANKPSISVSGTLTGGITNAGTITSTVSEGAVVVTGFVQGGITNSGKISIATTGSPTNYGAIVIGPPSGPGVTSFGGGITNNGTLSASASGTSADVIFANVSTFSGGITNNGTIAGTASADLFGINLTGGTFSGNVSNGGMISVAGVGSGGIVNGIGVSLSIFTGSIVNAGTIAATGTGGGSCNSVVANGVQISGNNFGAGLASAGGAVVNSGMISASATNSGHGCADGSSCAFAHAGAIGLNISANTFNGGITNNGTITATAAATGDFMACAQATGVNISVNTFIGGLTNSGLISATASSGAAMACSSANCEGSVTAAGAIGVNISVNTFNGGIFNGGTISATASYSNGCCGSANAVGVNISANTFNNGGITNAHGGTISAVAMVSNSTEARASATGLSVSVTNFAGGIINNGTISASASVSNSVFSCAQAIGVRVNEFSTFSGGIANNGLISASVTVAGSSEAGATALGVVVSGSNFSGGISNAGTISVSAVATGEGAGFVRLFATAVSVDVGTFSGGIANSGTILATASGGLTEREAPIGILVDVDVFSNGVSNSGTISVSSTATSAEEVESTGININAGAFSGGISNSGTINALATVSAGNAFAYSHGIELNAGSFGGGLSNGGTISASAMVNGTSGGVRATGISFEAGTFSGGIVNSGQISATASGGSGFAEATGLFVEASAFGGGTAAFLSNSGSIIARAGSAGVEASAYGVFVQGNTVFSGSIVNSGTIAGLITKGTGFGVGIEISQAGAVTISNSGLVEGTNWGIRETNNSSSSGTLTINLTGGTIAGSTVNNITSGGAIQLSSFADTINISGGTIVGNVVGGGSANVVNVNMGTGTFAYANEIEGIGTLNLKSGTLLLQNLTGPGVSTLNYNQSAGSTLALEVTPATTNNHASIIARTVSLGSNSVLQAFEAAAAWTPGTYTYAGVVTAGTVTGSFTPASNSPFFTASVTQTTAIPLSLPAGFGGSAPLNTSDTLTLTMLSPSQVPGLTPNQVSVANAIIGIPGGNSTLDQLFLLSSPGAALTQLSGSQYTQANYQPLIDAWDMFTNTLNDRLSQGDGYGGTVTGSLDPSHGLQFAAADIPQVAQMSDAGHGGAPALAQRWGVWARGYGLSSNAGSTATSSPYSESGAGVIIGADNQITDRIVAGVALNIATDKATTSGGGFTQTNAYQGTAYAQYSVDPNWYVNGQAGFGWENYSTQRIVSFFGTNVNNGNFNGQSYRAYAETGYALHPAFVPQARITPYLGLGYLHVHTDGFTETGSATALNVQAMDPNSFTTTIGARLATTWQVGSTVFRPELRAAWQHEFLDETATVRATFATAPGGTPFTATGTSFGSDSFIGGAGVTTTITSSTQVFLDYDAKVVGGYTAQAVSGGLRVQF